MEQLPLSTMMPFPPEFPAAVAAFGFKSTPGGAHNSRTMMLAEIRRLIETAPSDATLDDYREAVIEMNVLGKATATTRRKTFKLLHALYALSPAIPLFAIFRDLMRYDLEAAPLLSLLAAWSRDPLLRATTSVVLGADFGMEVLSQDVRNAVENAFPDRYSQASLGTATRNAASTWTQSEHLVGIRRKIRRRVSPRPSAIAFALCLSRAGGLDGEGLFSSPWCRLLDLSAREARDLASLAHREGLLTLKGIGPTVEVGFPRHEIYMKGIS